MREERKEDAKNIEFCRKVRKNKLSQLSNYINDYDADKFMMDLVRYFDEEIDFNIEKIRQVVEVPGRLSGSFLSELIENT
ncbi:MAG: hypothetical protein ABIH08_03575 [Candidatus Omnitrophota bacterium]